MNTDMTMLNLPDSKHGAGNKQKPEYICPYIGS